MRTSSIVGISVGAGLLLVAGMGIFVYRACSSLVEQREEGGVKLAADLSPSARAVIERQHLVKDGEKTVAYYDATLSLDGTDVFLLTDRRVVHALNGRVQAIDLERVTSVDHSEGGVMGETILV